MAPALAAAAMFTAAPFATEAEASKIGSLLGIKQGVLDKGSDVTDLTGKGTNVNLIIAKKFAKFGGVPTTGGDMPSGGGKTTGGSSGCMVCTPVCGGCGMGGALSPTSICLGLTIQVTINIDININPDICSPPTSSPTGCVCFGF